MNRLPLDVLVAIATLQAAAQKENVRLLGLTFDAEHTASWPDALNLTLGTVRITKGDKNHG